jgi:hypothetical protein
MGALRVLTEGHEDLTREPPSGLSRWLVRAGSGAR